MMNAKKNAKTAETEKTKASAVRSANKNEKEKDWHRLAALKAWETIRSRKQSKSVDKKVKKNGKVKEEKADDFEVSEEDVNGEALEKLQKENHKKQQRRTEMEKALNVGNKREVRAVEVGKIIKNAKIERSSAGVKLVAVA